MTDAPTTYWGNPTRFDSTPASLSGGSGGRLALTPNLVALPLFPDNFDPEGICVDSSSIYVPDAFAIAPPYVIWRCALDGSNPVRLVTGIPNAPYSVFVDATYIYYTLIDNGEIWRALKADGSGAAMFVSGLSAPYALTGDGTYLYVTNNGTGEIWRASQANGSGVAAIVTGLNDPQGVAVDGSHLYIAELTGKKIKRTAKDGSGLVTLIDAGVSFRGISVDDTYFFATTADGQSIARAVKVDGSDFQVDYYSTPAANTTAVANDTAFLYITGWTFPDVGTSAMRVPKDPVLLDTNSTVADQAVRLEDIIVIHEPPAKAYPWWDADVKAWRADSPGYLNVEIHSGGGGASPGGPTELRTSQIFDARELRLETVQLYLQMTPIAGAGQHFGPSLGWGASFPFTIQSLEFGVNRLDGSATFYVKSSASKIIPAGQGAPGGIYNMDSTLNVDWTAPIVTGTDLSKVPGNDAVVSAAGGPIWLYFIMKVS